MAVQQSDSKKPGAHFRADLGLSVASATRSQSAGLFWHSRGLASLTMATIRNEFSVSVSAERAWHAVHDFGALHKRLVPGFATAAHLDGIDRVVTFFNGTVLRERLVTLDEERRRLVWSIVDGAYSHHNGAVEVFAEDDGSCRLVWTAGRRAVVALGDRPVPPERAAR